MAISRSMDSDPINDIRTIIGNHYNSNSILKELIQNARDAGASTFYFKTVKGNPNANHELLKLDALVVFNDGDFSDEDADKITNIGSTHKLNSKSNVGKYGLGMKSIFHYCDAFFYVCKTETAIVNPWKSKHAKTHQNWDITTEYDDKILNDYFNTCQKVTILDSEKGFMLYVPLRNDSYDHYISKNKVRIETLWQPFNASIFKKSLVEILAVLPCTIDSNLRTVIVDTPQINTKLDLEVIDNKHHRIIVDKNESVYDVYFYNYEEKVNTKLKLIKETGKLPEKTEYDEDTDTEKVFSPYNEKQSPTLICILHKNRTSIGTSRFQFCCYLPLDDQHQVMEYKNSCEYDCDIFIHSEFETDGGRKSLLGVDLSKDIISFPQNPIETIVKEDEAQHWWNISLIQELLSCYLPIFIENSVLFHIDRGDSIVYNYQSFISDVYSKNKELIDIKYFFNKEISEQKINWSINKIEDIDLFYIKANELLKKELKSSKTIKDAFTTIKPYILNNEKYFDTLGIKRTLGTTHITFNSMFTEKSLELLLKCLIDKKIPIVFSPDFQYKLHLSNDTSRYLSDLFEPFKNSNSCECSDILNSFDFEKENLLMLCKKLYKYPICQVHNIREKNSAKMEYLSYEKIESLNENNCLYSGYLHNVDYLIKNLTAISKNIELYSISKENVLSKVFEDGKLLDVNNTAHIFQTINSSENANFTKDEALLASFFTKIVSKDDSIPNYLDAVKYILTNEKKSKGDFFYCDCQESELYTRLFSKSDENKIFLPKTLYNIFKQKNIPCEKMDSYYVKTYLLSGENIDFSILNSDEKDRFLLTLTGETFKLVPLHKTTNNNYVRFTEKSYLIVDPSIKLPANYTNDLISFIVLSDNKELCERQKEILRDSILTVTKALEILFDDDNVDFSDPIITLYLQENIKNADITYLNFNHKFREKNWILLSDGTYNSPDNIINLDSPDKNISLKSFCDGLYAFEDLNNSYKELSGKKIFLENADCAADVLLNKYPRKITIDVDVLYNNWDLVKPYSCDSFYKIVDCLFDNDKRKRRSLLDNNSYVGNGNISDYALFIINLADCKEDYNSVLDIVHLCLEQDIIQENMQSFLSFECLKLPTNDGSWNFARNISNKYNQSFSRKQQLNQSLKDVIKISEEDKTYIDQNNFETLEPTDINIKSFFTKVVDSKEEIDSRLLGLFLFLLDGEYRVFAEKNGYFTDTDKSVLRENIPFSSDITPEHWISTSNSVAESILSNKNKNRFATIIQIRKEKEIETKNLCNSVIPVSISNNKNGDILSEVNLHTPYNQRPTLILQFLYNDLSDLTSKQIKDAIQQIYKVGYYQRASLDDFFEKLLVSEQASIECTKRKIFKEIFSTLGLLKLKDTFSKEFDEYNESNYSETNNDRKIIFDLQNRICEDKDLQSKILASVRNYLSDNQYDSTRILYELLQNADDAVGQQIDLLEKVGQDSSSVSREFLIEEKGNTYLISHYGREINFRPSDQFPNSYKYDLSNMIQIANSSKEGQINTTGKFGLGFKSVYFLSNKPIIRSGRLHFSIIAGLYPEPCSLEKINKGETRIELRNDRNISDLLTSFEKNIELAVIFSKYIRSIKLKGKYYQWNCDSEIISEEVTIEENTEFFVIRMKKSMSSLVFKKINGEIVSMPDKFQKVWHTAPLLDEFKYLPFALNSNFDVDTGRKSLAKGHKNDRLILAIADDIADVFVHLYQKEFKEIGPITTLSLYAGLKSNDVLKPISEKICSNFYKKGIIPDGYNNFITVDNKTRIFSISETIMENYVKESEYKFFFSRIKDLLSINEDNALISDITKSLCRESIKSRLVEKEGSIRFTLIDYLYYAQINHYISAELFDNFIEYGLFEYANLHNELLPNDAMFKAADGSLRTIKEIFGSSDYELSEEYFDNLYAIKELIKIKDYTSGNQNNETQDNFPEEYQGTYSSSILDIYQSWKEKVENKEWETLVENYYNWIYPSSIRNKEDRFNGLNISEEEYFDFDKYDFHKPHMPKTWCVLFMLGILQSKVYWNHSETTRVNKIESLDPIITKFSDGASLDEVYNDYLDNHETDENDLAEFESLLRVYKFRKKFMQVFSQFKTVKHLNENTISIEHLLKTRGNGQASGSGLGTFASQKSLKLGISLIIRELLDCNFYGDSKDEQERAFILLNKFAYMPNRKLRMIVIGSDCPSSSEIIHDKIVQELRIQHIPENEIKAFMKWHDLPFLILG